MQMEMVLEPWLHAGEKKHHVDMSLSRNSRGWSPGHCLGCHCEKDVVWRATDLRTETRTRKVGAAQVDGVAWRTHRGKKAERGRHRDPNTCSLAQTTLKITTGCLCRGPSRRFQSARRVSTHIKLVQLSDSLVHVSRRVERDQKKNACM